VPRISRESSCGRIPKTPRAWPYLLSPSNKLGLLEKTPLHNLTDLGSRYRLPPLASYCLPGKEEVAGNLQYLFERFDLPLFCKRDNGGNLNHLAVNQVLEEALVIPLNIVSGTRQWGHRAHPGRL
jgi:hypothetical protein